MTRLNARTVQSLTTVATPAYDRSSASVGIVHFGAGNFHRSHQAMYLDRLMSSGASLDWGICGVGTLPHDAFMRDVMTAQDCLYTLVLRHPEGAVEPRVIGSILEYLLAPDDPGAVLARLEDPAVRIVTMTVTEGGYLKRPSDGAFDARHPDVEHDLRNPAEPRTAFAFVVEALCRRRAAGVPPFTVLSCDNLQGNGGYARQAVTGFADLVNPELGEWIRQEVAFPNAMVDRITPVTTDEDRRVLRDEFGVVDAWPVPAEPFTQWIVEDDFPSGRPPLEQAGVQFVHDVKPYELMKLRLLNASHQALAWFGGLLGDVHVDEAMLRPELRAYLLEYMFREAVPTLEPVSGVDLNDYINTLIERFSNPRMRDTLLRLGTDGSNRMATFVLPAICTNLAAGRPVELGAAMVAAWARYCELAAAGSTPAPGMPEDESSEEMLAAAARQREDPLAFMKIRRLFGDLADQEPFVQAFLRWRAQLLADDGVRRCLQALAA
ncbi:MAG TPA: mannitol dehydrogenase family protein [Kineosporiaceae bacterium]